MKTPFGTAVAAIFLLASAALAQDDDAEFGDRVRAYLMDHPEVILDALERLSAREAQAKTKSQIAAFPELFDAAPVLGIGAVDAPFRVVEFFDYKCAPCKAMHPGLKAYVAQNPQVRIEMRQLPILSPASERATRFALAVQQVGGDEAYQKAHDLLWSHRGGFNTVTFAKMSRLLALDFAMIDTAMADARITRQIAENRDIAIALKILGTPAFVSPGTVSFGQSDIAALAESWFSQ